MNLSDQKLRAEVILVTAIVTVSVLVVALIGVVLRSEQLHLEEERVVAHVRAARTEIIALQQAQSDAESLSARLIATRAPALLTEYESAKRAAYAHIEAARQIVGEHSEASARISQIELLVDRRFNILDAEIASRPGQIAAERPQSAVYAAFRQETRALYEFLNGRIDEARAAENAARLLLDLVSGILAVLSLVASGLAIFALRREREQWRLANEAAENARARAHAADVAKSRFLAVASHDMRQPLHALALYLSALERRVETQEARDIVAKMDRATQSMIGMFAMLLDLARVQAGVVTPEIEDAPLQPVFDRIAAEHPDGRVEIPRTSLAARTDPRLLERVIANLVINALKHGGGKARISVREAADGIEIEVADDGPGIPLEDQERIFDEFVRLEGRGEGLGLGLAIVRRISALLDMPLQLHSAPGEGTRFVMRLQRGTAPATVDHGDAPRQALKDAPILVMDDDALAREAIAGLLRDAGADVRQCANGDQVYQALDGGFRPHVLVLDLRIDGELRGIDIANGARARLNPPPPAIIVTGDTGPEALAALRASGHRWLIKPVDTRELLAAAAEAASV